MAMNTAAQGARTRREERARREKERIKRKASAPHTKLEDTTTPHHQTTKKNTDSPVFTAYLRTMPYIYRT
jgi:hypothetical protein